MKTAIKPLREFILHGNSGLSSWCLISVLVPQLSDLCEGQCGSFGLGSIPFDPSDFVRCHEALDLIPNGRNRLGEVAKRYPDWKNLVEVWADLERLYDEEILNGTGRAPKLYAAMKRARNSP